MDEIKENENAVKTLVEKYLESYLNFVRKTIDNKDFTHKVVSKLPFEQAVSANMEIYNDEEVEKMGFFVMRMDMADTYSLGVSMRRHDKDLSMFIAVLPSYDALRRYVSGDKFTKNVVYAIGKGIESS